MTVKEWKKQRNYQTKRLYELFTKKKRGAEVSEEDVLDCIQKGADLRRKDRWWGLPIWVAINSLAKPEVVKLLYDYGGLGEYVVVKNCIEHRFLNDALIYDLTIDWVISYTFHSYLTYKQKSYDKDEYATYEEYAEHIKEKETIVEYHRRRYEEYKCIFDIEKYDLEYCINLGIYDIQLKDILKLGHTPEMYGETYYRIV